ncbi:MAG: imidazole glycerol phosphate synthase subunit HisH [Actinomycetota bacterium]
MSGIAVLDYGMGNVRSVQRALERVGGRPEVTSDPDAASRADALLVPGVGAFGACMRELRARRLDEVIVRFAREQRPVLGVCLGLQVLFDGGEEDPDPGLAMLPGTVRRLLGGPGLKVPHMGWNEVHWTADHPYVRGIPTGTRFYFVHSFAVAPVASFTVGRTEHGEPFASVIARGSVFGTQFHPEKSGEPGLALYEAFVRGVRGGSSPVAETVPATDSERIPRSGKASS